MEFINYLLNKKNWESFLLEKQSSSYIDYNDVKNIKEIIDKEIFINLANSILDNSFFNTPPLKKEISKMATSKKRIVYYYNDKRQFFLKFINNYLYRYDYLFSNNLYSFRKHINVKNTILMVFIFL